MMRCGSWGIQINLPRIHNTVAVSLQGELREPNVVSAHTNCFHANVCVEAVLSKKRSHVRFQAELINLIIDLLRQCVKC